MHYKVVILAAGRGTRLGDYTKDVNKAILPVGFKAVISHIIEKFPKDIEIVIAIGHKKEILKEYLGISHPDRKISYVEIDRVEGIGSGPGYSLLSCKKHLQCPFVLSTADTMVLEDIPKPALNWLGVAPVEDTARFNSVKIKDGFVTDMKDKIKCDNTHAFIGLCGIYDYKKFWLVLSSDKALINNELQLSNGLKELIKNKLGGVEFSWFDTGDIDNFTKTCRYFNKETEDFDFSKTEEFIYFIGDRIIKYFKDPEIIEKRVKRAKKLQGFVPEIEKVSTHFYSYKKIPGIVMYNVLDDGLARSFFNFMHVFFWQRIILDENKKEEFKKSCFKFYHDKTKKRVSNYFEFTKEKDKSSIVNGNTTPKLADLLAKINWKILTDGVPSRFHGDLQFDNVLVSENKTNPFVLLDWRPDFAGLLDYGDIYYDLAKLYGGMILPYNLIKKNTFSYAQDGNQVNFDVASNYTLNSCRKIYEKFLIDNGYNLNKVRILTALIFLNMSSLHKEPFNFLLHHLGKLELMRALA